jgi:tight adherence protein C
MSTDIEFFLVGLLIIVAVASSLMLVTQLFGMVSDRGIDNLDPPPPMFRVVMPLVRFVSFYITSNFSDKMLNEVEAMLQKNGCSFMLTAEEYWAGRFVLGLVLGSFMAAGGLNVSGEVDWLYVAFAALLGWVMPAVWIRDFKSRRNVDLIKNLPVYLEYLTMCVDAGLNFSGAIKQAVDKGPHGSMRNEFRVILRDINSGYTRADALQRFEDRIGLVDISVFVRAVIQADKLGSSLKDTLSAQASQRLNERFQRAEKLAMEAPVKLIIPLVLFIFPLTFLILFFPIAMKFMEGGF